MTAPPNRRAEDGYEAYYFHKLRSWIPEVYWNDDLGDGSLEGYLRAIADRVAEMRREIDRIWTTSSIELADDWAVDLLGDLVGAVQLDAKNARGRRTAAANTMEYNRRKTTRYLLDKLITDTVSSEGYVREIERWLARSPHELEMAYLREAPLSRGPMGGLPQLTSPRADDAALPAFDEFARLPEFGPRLGNAASFDYAMIHFNLFDLRSHRIEMASPCWLDDTRATLDPSGRAVPLFHSGSFDHRNGLLPVGPEEFPTPMDCERFNDAEFEIPDAGLAGVGTANLRLRLAPWTGIRFRTLQAFRRTVRDALTTVQFDTFFGDLQDACIVPDCAKRRQLAADVMLDVGEFSDQRTLRAHNLMAANLGTWFAPAAWPEDAALLLDVETGAVQFATAPDTAAVPPRIFHPLFHHAGAVHEVGAGTWPRDSTLTIGPPYNDASQPVLFAPPAAGLAALRDNRRHEWQWDALTRRHDVMGSLTLEVADRARPYVVSQSDAATLDFTLHGTAGQDNHLVIDGLWLGILANAPIETNVGAALPAPVITARLILDGTFETVTLRHVTLDPGGEQIRLDPAVARSIPAIRLEMEGSVKSLLIEESVLGPVVETRNDPKLQNAGVIRIRNSVIQSIDAAEPAIAVQLGRLYLENTTVFGECHAKLLFATNTIFDGPVHALNRQQSCLRFSALGRYLSRPEPARPALPRLYECAIYDEAVPQTSFLTKRFGDPRFAALSDLADRALAEGGEYQTEMGVGNKRMWRHRCDDLARVAERFLPVDQNAQIFEDFGGLP
jgi:hypothetical protein